MSTGAPSSRKTHVIRIFGTNRDGERLSDVYVDVERMDTVRSSSQSPETQWQGEQRKLLWADDPAKSDYEPDGVPSRKTRIVKVCDPEAQDVDDPDEWVPVPVILEMSSLGGNGIGQGFVDKFLDDDEETSETARIFENRRISHYDTNIDDAAQSAADADSSLLAYVVDGQDYTRDESTKDDSQYVEHEVATHVKYRRNTLTVDGQAGEMKLLNQYLVDASDPAKLEKTGNRGIDPPYRLDPFQNIVNVKFSFKVYVIVASANGEYAMTDKPGVKVIETRTDPSVLSNIGPVGATLLECSANAGEDFMTLSVDPGSNVGAVNCYVVPKKDEVLDDWFEAYVRDPFTGATEGGNNKPDPSRPLLWNLSPFYYVAPTVITFKIRYKPHLLDPQKGDKDAMVQMYPTSGLSHASGPSGSSTDVTGWTVNSYRTDREGTGQLYETPPEWQTDVATTFVDTIGGVTKQFGLLFGTDPPKIAGDVLAS